MFVVAYGSPVGRFKLHGPFPDERSAADWGEAMGEGGEWVMEVQPLDPNGNPEGSLYPTYRDYLSGTLKPVRWSWDDAYADGPEPSYTWPGFWDGTRWNGFPNIKVTKDVFDRLVKPTLLADLEDTYDDPEDLANYRQEVEERGEPDEFGLCSLGYGYTPTMVDDPWYK